jgi:excisionase family DNA binding protein
MSETPPIFVSRKIASKMTGLSTGMLDALIRQGSLRVTRVGRRVLIRTVDLQNLRTTVIRTPDELEVNGNFVM